MKTTQQFNLFLLCFLSFLLFFTFSTTAGEIVFYVASNGNDNNSGKSEIVNGMDGPFATLSRAKEKVRQLRKEQPNLTENVVIELCEGDYELAQPLEFGPEESGTEQSRTILQGQSGKKVRLLGGKRLGNWTVVSDPAILEQLDPNVHGKVYQTNLKELGMTDFGSPGGGGAELFFDSRPMHVARYPNQGFIKIGRLFNQEPVEIHGVKGDKIGRFRYEDDRVNRWKDEKDPWVHGYWFWDWSEQRHQIKSIEPSGKTLEVVPPYHSYGYRRGQWFYGFNLLCEIDEPGEYYIDRDASILYFYPPTSPEKSESFLSQVETLLSIKDASFLTVRDLLLEGCRSNAINISGGQEVLVAKSTIRNIGGSAVAVQGGLKHGVQGCDIYEAGGCGITLTGGDRTTLSPGEHFADNNNIHHFARIVRVYQPGVSLYGVGNRATHNRIADAPHMGIGFGGNDHLMEFNILDNVCYESNDAGAIYAGRDWTMRGNMIRNNFFKDIEGFEKKGCVGVYLDDMFASAQIVGNIFLRVTRAAMIGGGRDNSIVNNIFIDCVPSLHVDARALGWCAYHADEWLQEAAEKGTISGIDWKNPPYSTRYPELATILEKEPKAPEGNVITHNICLRGVWDQPAGFWKMSIEEKARPYLKMEDNIAFVEQDGKMSGIDPGFENDEHPEEAGFRLRADSPAIKAGFKPIPFEQIGPYEDANRISWPVR